MTTETWTPAQFNAEAALACAAMDHGRPRARARHLDAALAALGDLQRAVLLERIRLDNNHTPATAGKETQG